MKPCLIRYGIGDIAIGKALVALSPRGLCALRLIAPDEEKLALAEIRQTYPQAHIIADPKSTSPILRQVRELLAGRRNAVDYSLDLHGTPFQVQVWEALRKIPRGQTCSYSDLARKIGRPRAVRAVANACARNRIAILVPCHRVLRKDGGLGGYYWGPAIKRELLHREQAEDKRQK